MSSWLGASVLSLGEWFIKRMPFVRHIYSASKQISAAISPDQNTQAFKEVAIIRHPRIGEYAFGFITSSVVLQLEVHSDTGREFSGQRIHASVKEYPHRHPLFLAEIVVSGGMSMPLILSTLDSRIIQVDRSGPNRS
ncbi:like COV 1 [Actinidia rufa]|uniref:Like COV 1 n=1 Tax=Actinidia rufa TaxID=165716 RepID=A0A7J0E2X7_9ERIC|nr:like COV 1 [Actinidia rufa]